MHASNWNKKPRGVLKMKVILSMLKEINWPGVVNEKR